MKPEDKVITFDDKNIQYPEFKEEFKLTAKLIWMDESGDTLLYSEEFDSMAAKITQPFPNL